MSAHADAGHGEHGGDEKKMKWWFPLAILSSVGLGLMLLFALTGQPLAEWSSHIRYTARELGGAVSDFRPAAMMLLQMGIMISGFIWLIKWAVGNRKNEQEIAKLQADLAIANAKKKTAATPAAAATPATAHHP